jgi:hypothetical protein
LIRCAVPMTFLLALINRADDGYDGGARGYMQ